MPISVHHFGRFIYGHPLRRVAKILMDMPMDKIRRLIFFNQPAEALKSFVTGIFRIMNVPRRCMGNHHIDPSSPPKRRSESTDDRTHLSFCILIRSAIVPVRTLQTENVYAFIIHQSGVQIKPALRPRLFIPNIMVATYIIKGHIKIVNQTGKVFRWQVTTGDDQIDFVPQFSVNTLI